MDASGGLTSRSTGAQRPDRVVGLTAVEIAALVRSGEVSAEEVTRAHLDVAGVLAHPDLHLKLSPTLVTVLAWTLAEV